MKLRKKLIGIFIVISIIPLLTSMGIILLQSASAIRRNAQGFLSEYAATVAKDIAVFFAQKAGLVKSASFFPALTEMAWPEVKRSLSPLLKDISRTDDMNMYLLVNPDGSYYRSDNEGNPAHGGLVTADNTDPGSNPTLLTNRDYFKVLVENNPRGEHRTYVSNPMLSRASGQKMVIVGSSLINTSDETAGAIGFYIEDHTMKNILDAITAKLRENFGERLLFFIFSEDDAILSRREYDPGQNRYTERALNVNEEFTVNDLPGSLQETYRNLIREETATSYRNEISGERYYMTSSPISGTGYRVVLTLPEPVLYGTIRDIQNITVIVLSATVIIVFLLAFFLSLQITGPLVKMVPSLKAIGEGDLTQMIRVNSKDETGDMVRYFNVTVEKIKNLVNIIKNQAVALFDIGSELASNMTETAAAINEITANMQSINDRVTNQSASVMETNATMEQIAINIDRLNGHVDRQSENVSQSSSAIEEMLANIQSVTQTLVKNAANVKELTDASEGGRTGLQEVAADIQEIARESEGLLEINAVMENIASQTNLLSMNAAIEAAHAGEAGKGFAVVASEIRKLAEHSGDQSKTITAVLKKIKDSIDKITTSTERVLNKFEAIDRGVKTVSEQEENIRSAMEEQGEGSKQILQAVAQLNDSTQMVRDGSMRMLEGSEQVIHEGKRLVLITQEIANGMNEMASGLEQINIAVNQVNEISGQNKESINVLVKEVSKFKVE
ncbi:MAG: methyl-accepting chemotaxis protein [Treponema sp.]|jgi:methyl-accepting chemotaxis protein|nr:methyl-accepting chemotaxis protein [Treponema sp.]